MTKLLYFTTSFPYGIGENWKFTEVETLSHYFDEVVVVPLTDRGGDKRRPLPENIRVLKALFKSDAQRFCKMDAAKLINRRLITHLTALFRRPKAANFRVCFKQWAVEALKLERILKNEYFQEVVSPELRDSVLYFFWGKGYAGILPFLAREIQNRSVVRLHGYDLYWERNDGYVPYQALIVESARYLLTVSQHGASYLRTAYRGIEGKVACRSLGTLSKGLARSSDDGVLRLVSCAFVSDVKRLHLILHALKCLGKDVEWTHIGGGERLVELRDLADSLGVGHNVTFTGDVPAERVVDYYSSKKCDLFLNVSASEGLPVSIMEALAAGIPVLATKVGGNSEIVDSHVGWLLPEDLDADILARNIERFRNLSAETRARMRVACFNRYKEHYDAVENAVRLKELLLEVCTGKM